MATVADWIEGARPRTWPAAIAPVLLGTGCAFALGARHLDRALLALVVAVALQVGVNYANDYSDGIRGTDDDRSVGPVRLVGQKLAPPSQVKTAAFLSFGVAAFAGVALVVLSGAWWLLAVGAAAIVAAWFYTGGSRPYGYLGLGEVFVFVFFGLAAVLGTQVTQSGTTSPAGWAGAVGVGALSCAILMANNVRDIPTDKESGKHTLAVRLGDARARRAYVGIVASAFIATIVGASQHPGVALSLAAIGLGIRPALVVLRGGRGRALIPVLAATGRMTLAYGFAYGLGAALWPAWS